MVLGFGAHLMADIPFLWLDSPKGRDNKFDPKSPLFVPTNTPVLGTPTDTPTRTNTLTLTVTNTLTNTRTSTPTLTATPTLTPVIDGYDPNDNTSASTNTLTGAAVAGAAQTQNGHFVGDATDTADYFVMTLTVGQTYDFVAVRTSGGGVLSIEVRDGSDVIIGSASTSATSPVTTYTATMSTVYVVVRRTGGVIGYNFSYQNTTGAAPTDTPTVTSTDTATATYTLTNTGTNTYTMTNTATPTNTVGGPTATPTPTNTIPAGPHGALVADFEDNTANDKTLWDTSAVTIYHSLDTFGSTMTQAPWTATSGVAPGAGNSSSYAACIDGNLLQDGPPNYPFAQLTLELISTGGKSDGTGAFVNVSPYSPSNGLKFKYKAAVANIPYRIILIQNGVTAYNHFRYDFTPTDTAWHTMNVYFPGSGSLPVFAQPYGPFVTFDPTHIGGISIYPLPTASAHAYAICIDDVTFAADPYVPAGHTALVTDFECNTCNDRTYWDTSAATMFSSVDSFGSTMTQNPWGASSAVAPGAGNSSNFAGCIDGSLQQDGPPNYPFAQIVMELIAGGSTAAGGGTTVDVSSYQGLQFKYKATVAGIPYRVVLIQSTVTDYGHFQYVFTPSDTAWHTVNVYFPGIGPVPQQFSKPYGSTPWDATKIGAVTFYPLPVAGSTHNYGICVDDVTFAVDPPPTPTPTATPGGSTTTVVNWEIAGANDKTNSPFTGDVALSIDPYGSTITESPWGPNSATAGGGFGTSAYAGCIDGQIMLDGPPNYPYAQISLNLLPGGGTSDGTGATIDLTPYTPTNAIQFDYKVSVANVAYRVALVQSGITDYAHYQYSFTPTDTAWHTMTVYFPGFGPPELSRPYGGPTPAFDKTKIGAIQFYPLASASTHNYGICVDNVLFK